MTPDPATRARKLAWHSHAFGCECRSDYDDERCVKLRVRLQAAVAALTEPGRGPETGPDVALRKELRRAMTVLMEAEAGSLEHFSRHPGSQPRSEQWQSCRICGVVAERIRDVVHRPTCWFKNVAEQIDRLAALTEPVASDAREAPATPIPDGPDGEPR